MDLIHLGILRLSFVNATKVCYYMSRIVDLKSKAWHLH